MNEIEACLFVAHGLEILRLGLPAEYHQWHRGKIERFPDGFRQETSNQPNFRNIIDAAGYRGQLPSWGPWQGILKNNASYCALAAKQQEEVNRGHWLHPEQLLQHLLLSYLGRVDSLEYRGKIAQEVAFNFASSLVDGANNIALIIPVFGINLIDNELDLGDGIKMSRLSDETVADLCAEFPVPSLNADFPSASVVLVREKAYTLDLPPSDMGDFGIAAERILTSLRLSTGGEIALGGCYQLLQKKGQLHVGHNLSYVFPRESLKRPSNACDFKKEDVSKVIGHYKILVSSNLPKKMRVALARFNLAYDRTKWEDELVDLLISLEAIFGDGRGANSYKIALRAAVFVGADKVQRLELFSLVEEGYRLRNSLVHGSESSVNQAGKGIRNVARRTIQILLERLGQGHNLFKAEDFDALLLR